MSITRIKQIVFAFALLCLCAWSSADTYSYDKLNRLTAVTYPNGDTKTYSYDPAGNLVTATTVATLVPKPVCTLTGDPASVSAGSAATLTASCSLSPIAYVWTGGTCVGTTASSCTVTPAATTTYTVAGTIAAGTGTPASATVTVTPLSYLLTVTSTGSGTIVSNPAGIDCGSTCSVSFNSGTSVILSAPPAIGSTFAGWSGDCSGSSTCVVSMSANRNVGASFTTASGGGGALSYPSLLALGWNLLGNSLNQTLPVASIYGDPAIVTTVWKWDILTQGWQFYTPQMDAPTLQTYATSKGYGVLSVINPGEGYWVNAKVPASLGTQSGPAFSLATANLVKGWNLTATGDDVFPSTFNLSLSATPASPGTVPLNLTTLWAWDNPLSLWYFYEPSLDASGGLADYITSKGYLDFTAGSKTLGNGMGFWVNRP